MSLGTDYYIKTDSDDKQIDLDSEIKKNLSSVLDDYDRGIGERQQAVKKTTIEEVSFVEEFKRLRAEVIRPILEEFGGELRQRGHEYEIKESESGKDDQGRTLPAYIGMAVYPKDFKRSEFTKLGADTPWVGFTAWTYEKKIAFGSSNIMPGRGGSSGSSSEHKIEELTHDLVMQQVAKGLKRIFGPTWGQN